MTLVPEEREPHDRRAEDPPDHPERVSCEEAFELLRNERRRRVLRYLRVTPTTTTGELAEHVAAEEIGTTPERLGSTERKRVYISLYQSHLPTLADARVIEYDRDRGTVERSAAADAVDRHLDRFDGTRTGPAVGLRYGALALEVLVVAGALGISPLGALSPPWWAVVGTLTLVALLLAT